MMRGEKPNKSSDIDKVPRIKRHLSDIRCYDGDSVTLECEIADAEIDSSSRVDFRWYKDGELIPLGREFVANVNGNVASLVIERAYREDEGQYDCVVSNIHGMATSTACLIVNDNVTNDRSCRIKNYAAAAAAAPKFRRLPFNKMVEEGDTVRFECVVSGYPAPTAVWDKWNVPIKSTNINCRTGGAVVYERDNARFLEMTDIRYEDAGIYRVIVQNEYGQCEATVRLEVINHRRRHRKGHETINEKYHGRYPVCKVANICNKCAIFCNIPNGMSKSTATWYKNGELLKKSDNVVAKFCDSSFQLQFNELRREDSAVYTCIMENNIGKTRCSAELIAVDERNSDNMDLRPPVFVVGIPQKSYCVEGKPFQFRIKLQGALPINVTWYKNDEKLPNCEDFEYVDYSRGEFALNVNDTFADDSGSYKCEACNNHGDAISTGHLMVTELFRNNRTQNSKQTSTVMKTALEARLESDDNSCPKIRNDYVRFKNNTIRSVTTINDTNSASNVDSTNSVLCHNRLCVNDSLPARIIEGPPDVSVLRGESVSMIVKFIGNPDPVVKWMKAGRELTPNDRLSLVCNGADCESVLRLNQVTADDGGKYEIIVGNVYGTDTRIASLAVEGSPDAPNGQPNAIAGDRCATVTWCSPPYDGGSKITGYTIEMRSYSTAHWKVVVENCHSLFCTVRGLIPGESYVFRIRAENVYGLSAASVESVPAYVAHADANTVAVERKKVTIQNGESFANGYDVLEELGKGRYGIVRRTIDKEFGNCYAAKFVRCIKTTDKEKVREEIAVMNLLQHPKLLRLIAAYENSKEIIMVTEYISGGELFERVVADDFTLTERDCILFTRQICEGVAYIHKNNVVHLDLKPENIMCVSRTSHQIKLIDFGLARKITPDTPVRVLFGTPEFIPPEIINYEPIGTESDMWSVGVICYVLLSGLSPFMGDNDAETFANITRADFDFDDEAFEDISKDAKDFISSLLIKRKEKRLTAKQCAHHKWLAQHDKTMSCVKLCTDKLKKFIIRRKWQKTGNAIRALGRMTSLSVASRLSSSGANSSTCSSPRYGHSGVYSSRMSSSGDDNVNGGAVFTDNVDCNSQNSIFVANQADVESSTSIATTAAISPFEPQSKIASTLTQKSVTFRDTNTTLNRNDDDDEGDAQQSQCRITNGHSANIDNNNSMRRKVGNSKDRISNNLLNIAESSVDSTRVSTDVLSRINDNVISNKPSPPSWSKLKSHEQTNNSITTKKKDDKLSMSFRNPQRGVNLSKMDDEKAKSTTTTTSKSNNKFNNVNYCKTNEISSPIVASMTKVVDRKEPTKKESTNSVRLLDGSVKIRAAERLKKFEQLTTAPATESVDNHVSTTTTKNKKNAFVNSSKSNFQKAIAFWNRENRG